MVEKTKRSVEWIKTDQNYLGTHLIAEFWDAKDIENSKKIEEILVGAVKAAKCTPLEFAVHKFSPQGITGVIILAESHIAIHSWPEYHYVAVDVFTCGSEAMPYKAIEYLKNEFQPKRVDFQEIKRGATNQIKDKCQRIV